VCKGNIAGKLFKGSWNSTRMMVESFCLCVSAGHIKGSVCWFVEFEQMSQVIVSDVAEISSCGLVCDG